MRWLQAGLPFLRVWLAFLRITEIAAEPRNYQNSAHGISKFTALVLIREVS
jgi:hypothetical protein